MTKRLTSCFSLCHVLHLPGGTLEVGVLDAQPVEVGPVEAGGGGVDGEAVGAAHLRREEDLAARPVHVGLLDQRHRAPAAPVHQAVRRVQRKAAKMKRIIGEANFNFVSVQMISIIKDH